ncbi:N-acetylglucosaminyldiphosphodolichol N-acetylglucosaminyltransferase Alg13 [Gongronella butleri]|nr:N-acetylglucosaminyldiphosphodolichol N-acetylglucosaminyltransferase Alg13 [Gongronella butleri]
MRLFVTVGSFGFDSLITTVSSAEVRQWLVESGYTDLLVQYGSSRACFVPEGPAGLRVDGYDYKTHLDADMAQADVVVCHAGAGTLLQGLRLGKKMVVVVNEQLLGNHQVELARSLAKHQYVVLANHSNLGEVLATMPRTTLQPFPQPDASLFTQTLDRQMGFSV